MTTIKTTVDTVKLDKDVHKVLLELAKLEGKAGTTAGKLLELAKSTNDLELFLKSCGNAEVAYKEANNVTTVPRVWRQAKSEIKRGYDFINEVSTLNELKDRLYAKAKKDKAADKAEAKAEEAKALEAEPKLSMTKETLKSAKAFNELGELLTQLPEGLQASLVSMFLEQAKDALKAAKAPKPKATKKKTTKKAA